ncbi:ATP phosphoribosyltransferase regulatory subunit [Anaerobacillus sp. MEB173]|uniref:ATP phosphoribosyltransferase regulatory subunit n=1 Tax=Anaerobacillus sp. MEB173 TaxID=3383345 RepID=UPI003F8FB226
MTKPFMFEKPLGMRDTLPQLFQTKQNVRNVINDEISKWGYDRIETPTLEFYDTVGVASAILDQQLFKLLDQQGNTLVLRPDMTAPIARLAASSLRNESYPLRLTYDTNLFRAQQHEGGRPAEFEQIGVELIGDGTASADGEVIALMIAALKKAGVENFQVAIGHVGYVNALMLDILGNEERANVLRRYLYEKNYVGYRQHVKSLSLSSIDKGRLLDLLQLRGGEQKLDEAKKLVQNEQGEQALNELTKLWDVLKCYGVTEYLKIDLNLVMHMSYYTGVVFEGYSSNLGFPLSSGGRYDELLTKFNRPGPATGFGLRLDLLVEALGRTEEKQSKTCIVYSNERRAEAIALASDKRESGETVVLQDLKGVKEVDVLSEQFDDVIYCIGKNGKGE